MRFTIILAALVLCGAASSQVPTGTFLRPMELGELHNGEAKSLGAHAGRLVLVEFFAYW